MFNNKNNWPLEHWHIEVSSKCPLQCPRCTRQELPEGLVNTDIRVDWFENNFKNIIPCVKKITFCGDDGDPIYCRDFLEICKWIKKHNKDCQLVIITNGSYKTKIWWQKLSFILSENDHIHFSIDGNEHTNNNYRVNAHWLSIMDGIDVLNKNHCRVFKTWACIAFAYNINQLNQLKNIAKEKHFDYFQLTKSSKFGSNYEAYLKNDPLEPSKEYVSEGRFTRTIENINNREWKDNCLTIFKERYKLQEAIGDIQPLCSVGNKGLYINAQGNFYPCCWTGLRYEHTKNLFPYIDYSQNFEQVLNDPAWQKLFDSFNTSSCPSECKIKCSSKRWNISHATEW